LRAAKTAEQKLQTIDHMLSIVHQRSDLAGWFVEGGRKTLSQLAGFSSKTASFGIPADLQAIEDKYKAQGVTIWMNHYQRDGDPYIELSSVEVPKNQRKQGLGTAFMTDLMKWADANGEPIFLTPSTSRGGSSVGRLQAFYGRFGFVRNHGRNKDFRSQDAMVRVPRGAAKTAAAKPESILVIVHPGSACGSADFNYGSRDTADAERTGLIREWTNWRGGVIVIDGELSDELPDYPELNAALTSVVDRAKSAGKVSLREYGQDPAQVRVIKQVVKTRGWTPADVQFSCTGAWAYSDSDGCVGDVNKVLRQMGFSSKITDAALTGEWG
jgi:GNAT superfamily N-acetyltransferase